MIAEEASARGGDRPVAAVGSRRRLRIAALTIWATASMASESLPSLAAPARGSVRMVVAPWVADAGRYTRSRTGLETSIQISLSFPAGPPGAGKTRSGEIPFWATQRTSRSEPRSGRMAAASWLRACSGPAMTISIGLSWPGAAPDATTGPPNADSSPQRMEAAFMVCGLPRSFASCRWPRATTRRPWRACPNRPKW